MNSKTELQPQAVWDILQALRAELGKALIGQPAVVDQVLIALLAAGHVLIEGVPGLGKTLLAQALAKCIAGRFARIQFTADLMPSDITGHALYNMRSERFEIRRGPVFCHLLLADEINRAPAKTQAALLEVMQEGQATIKGHSFALEPPFMVLATQNPIEEVDTVAFAPNGRMLASGSDDETIKLWNAATGQARATLTGHTNAVYAVAFAPDGRTLASGSGDTTIKLWDPATGQTQVVP